MEPGPIGGRAGSGLSSVSGMNSNVSVAGTEYKAEDGDEIYREGSDGGDSKDAELFLASLDTERDSTLSQRAHTPSWNLSAGSQMENFRTEYPEYLETEELFESLRSKDFPLLDQQGATYLDYTGSMLAPHHLVGDHAKLLQSTLLGNPHSNNDPSLTATRADERARLAVLRMMNADPEQYECIWTHNASSALELVGVSYPFNESGAFLCAPDVHNSVIGIINHAQKKHAKSDIFDFSRDGFTLEWSQEGFVASERKLRSQSSAGHRLLAIPAQSNTSGIQHPLKDYIKYAHKKGWDVLVDAAARVPTCGFDIAEYDNPEFCCLSFYKIFGYPTGVGALIAKKTALSRMVRDSFAGGTVRFVLLMPHETPTFLSASNHARFEEGTIPFQQVSAIELGVKFVEGIGFKNIKVHTWCLMQWLIQELLSMKWGTGEPLVVVPGGGKVGKRSVQAGSVSFVVQDPTGSIFPSRLLEDLARDYHIALRVGCFCNPGSGMHALMIKGPKKWTEDVLMSCQGNRDPLCDGASSAQQLHHLLWETDPETIILSMKDIGLVRVSVGMPTNFNDIQRLLCFLKEQLLEKESSIEGLVSEWKKKPAPYSLC